MRFILSTGSGPVFVSPYELMLATKRHITYDDGLAVPGTGGAADAAYCLSCLQMLFEQNRKAPARLEVRSNDVTNDAMLALAGAMRKEFASMPIATLGRFTANGSVLAIAAGTPGHRFVAPNGVFHIAPMRLTDELQERLERFKTYGEEIPAGEDDEMPMNIKNIERVSDAVEANNEVFRTLMREFCGEKVEPLLEMLKTNEALRVTAEECIAYGIADYILTDKNAHLFYGVREMPPDDGDSGDAPPLEEDETPPDGMKL